MFGNHDHSQDHHVVQFKQPFSLSSASLSSSLSTSVASSTLLPAGPSSHFDISTSDQLPTFCSSTLKSHSGGPISRPTPYSFSSPPSMGQVNSRPEVATPPLSPSPPLPSASPSAGFRLARAFVGRRKKSDTLNTSSGSSQISSRVGREHQSGDESLPGTPRSAPPRPSYGAKQLTLSLASHVFSKKHTGSASAPVSPAVSLVPPPPPPKIAVPHSVSHLAPVNTNIDKRGSVMTTTSPIAPALDFMRRVDEASEFGSSKENERRELDKSELKEIRRKSDSTLSHHTIKPGFGTRNPRPVSMAESLQSNHTIVPVSKRLSAFLTEADNCMAEEEDGESIAENACPTPLRSTSPFKRGSPASSIKVGRDRRSQSLNLGPPLTLMTSAPDCTAATASMSMDAIPAVFRSMSEDKERSGAAVGFSSLLPSAARGTSPVPSRANVIYSDCRPSSPLRPERNLPDIPAPQRRFPPASTASPSSPSFRQTAISITGLAPAAGLARRAVEKMGRVWGKASSPTSTYTSAQAGSTSSSFSSSRSSPLSRASSGNDEPSNKTYRHAPQASSASWSISSASSASDHEGLLLSPGPIIGKRLRGPLRMSPKGAGVAGGLVFGRDLKTCVRDTAIDSVRNALRVKEFENSDAESDVSSVPSAPLESRRLPALVVRCAQHILTCGIQELGLFRVNGRSSHVAKLRSEFDTGADFDIAQCNPAHLDPHAVASIFKAYLRELREPILTNVLSPAFEAAMTSERLSNNMPEPSSSPRSIHPGLRKPPSLSTLAMPNFSGSHPPSESLRKALSSLIARLPQENRDLLLTVTEIINATAQHSEDTRMPLNNLLLVLCPSLSMNPSLVQALCECKGIWNEVQRPVNYNPPARPSRESVPSLHDVLEEETLEKKDVKMSLKHDDSGALPEVPADDMVEPLAAPANTPVDVTSSQSSIATRASLDAARSTSDTSSFAPTDDSSSVSQCSQQEHPITPPSVNVKLPNPYSPPSLSSSTDSLSSPSVSLSSHLRSAKHLPLLDDFSEPQTSTSPHTLIIADPAPLSLPTSRHVQPQFQFPSTGGDLAHLHSLMHRKSTPSMSFPSVQQTDVPNSNSLASRAKRMKKPSLHLLFSKRSASPISSPIAPVYSRNSSASESSPVSMMTAQSTSRFSFPPVLNTAIDSSSISLALGIEEEEQSDLDSSVGHATAKNVLRESVALQSPILPGGLPRSPTRLSAQTPYRHIEVSLPDDDEFSDGDWTQSVLLAAGESVW
ncbi:RhoGAP-domain-containing protein [Rhizopogon vinicolor AM-OR11-026]|uniref:RhoGAP-domain-containing protein n=1 Tax=Rhizopogon vinicolor AM-OR11-026 TaxID=1314800 RepID=A0A1B7NGU6_9AGAM|nr:RhoGAP-domain-containing protein [Rhizopogon vinicolor AM-OR11-026]